MIVYVQQNFGSGGSGAVVVYNDYIDVTTDKTRVSISINFPSIIGKTIGDNSFVNILITKQAGASSFTGKAVNLSSDVRISNVKFGYNDIYVSVDPETELSKCKNYFERKKADSVYTPYCIGEVSAGSVFAFHLEYTEKHKIPSITFSSITHFRTRQETSLTSIIADYMGKYSARVLATSGSSLNVGESARLFSNNTTDGFIDIVAEL